MGRERTISELYVRLSDTLVSGYHITDFLQALVEGCREVLEVDVVGVLLERPDGELALSAASDEDMRTLEALELQSRDGPCYDAYRAHEQVIVEDLAACAHRWPEFVPKALDLGFRAGHGFPLRLRHQTIGALNLYSETPGPLAEDDVHLAQSLADVATIGIINERTIQDVRVLSEQLQAALAGRVIIEQAKGMLAEREGTTPAEAFERIRRYARANGAPLRDVAHRIVAEGFVPD